MTKYPEDETIRITMTVDRIEDDQAVLMVDDDEVIMPKKFLPRGVKEGDVICLSASTEENDRKRREKKARDLLNEILKGEGNS